MQQCKFRTSYPREFLAAGGLSLGLPKVATPELGGTRGCPPFALPRRSPSGTLPECSGQVHVQRSLPLSVSQRLRE